MSEIQRIEFRTVFNDVRCSEWKIIPDLFENKFLALNKYLINEYQEDPRLLIGGYNNNFLGIFEDKFDYQFRYVETPPRYVSFGTGMQIWVDNSNNWLDASRLGRFHRDDGPAMIFRTREPRWFFHGNEVTDRISNFEIRLNKTYIHWTEEEWTWFKLT